LHLYVNAQVSLWFGEFIHPDWDMFQSGHPWGAYHAAARAISGGPVYVSDKPGMHNFDLLRKLVLPDSGILRALRPARPTRDCLFHDPTREDVLLKIFNLNHEAGVIGVFNARYDPQGTDTRVIAGSISPKDVAGLQGELFAVYAHNSGELRLMDGDEQWDLALPQAGYEIFTVVPVDTGVAPLGLVDMFNSAGAIIEKGFITREIYRIRTRGSGRFAIWCSRKPLSVVLQENNNGQPRKTHLPFSHVADTSWLEFDLGGHGQEIIDLVFSAT
jgi:raffinose synthase